LIVAVRLEIEAVIKIKALVHCWIPGHHGNRGRGSCRGSCGVVTPGVVTSGVVTSGVVGHHVGRSGSAGIGVVAIRWSDKRCRGRGSCWGRCRVVVPPGVVICGVVINRTVGYHIGRRGGSVVVVVVAWSRGRCRTWSRSISLG